MKCIHIMLKRMLLLSRALRGGLHAGENTDKAQSAGLLEYQALIAFYCFISSNKIASIIWLLEENRPLFQVQTAVPL